MKSWQLQAYLVKIPTAWRGTRRKTHTSRVKCLSGLSNLPTTYPTHSSFPDSPLNGLVSFCSTNTGLLALPCSTKLHSQIYQFENWSAWCSIWADMAYGIWHTGSRHLLCWGNRIICLVLSRTGNPDLCPDHQRMSVLIASLCEADVIKISKKRCRRAVTKMHTWSWYGH